MKRFMTATMLVAVGVGTLAACSSHSTPSAESAPKSSVSVAVTGSTPPAVGGVATSAAPRSTASRVSSPAASQPTTPSAALAATNPTYCAESQLRATIDPRHVPGNGTLDAAGAMKKGVIVDFENTSSRTCVLIGYPGAATVSAAGTQVTQATRTLRGELDGLPAGTSTIPKVSLAPGHYADAMIEGVDHQQYGAAQAGCADNLPSILVTPPNTEIAVPFDVSWPACYSFDVHPVMALTIAP